MPKPPRRWSEKFRDAAHGVWLGLRDHVSFRVQVGAGLLAVMLGVVLKCDAREWGLLIAGIGMVLVAELINSALETMFHGLDDAAKGRISGCLDLAAGAVLLAALTAVALGAVVFGPKIWELVK